MPHWMTQWRSLLGALLLFALVAITLGTLAARFVSHTQHERPKHLIWTEVCTPSGNQWVLIDLSTP